ncbi:TPA: hypothetical protein PWU90_002386 [Mannheimia haemolytica]|uniref:hypothetical protein n=1 Tax=Mannheimia haemolytica TaxID=75985 RepID=UPI00077E5E04|nr:hypothetical protein [Mannheimia haemolytica]KYL11772.1 hypothetical protein AC568_01625 [Mannheimia haemolytica]MEE3731783.1 hypothetical protein [Mannheimia haemolytica]UFK43859.1 hypothetical protein LO774_06630 [Mannheimia haemolytica]SQE32075.1 Uncharacterised protein [Mannheimia haemolytica]HDL1114074.1 hypothetical protein [Mannheimia haemolytica]
MKVSKEHQEWIKQYAQRHNISEEEALNKLIGDVRNAEEIERENLCQAIIERVPKLNLEQLREIRQLIENYYPTFFHILSEAVKK